MTTNTIPVPTVAAIRRAARELGISTPRLEVGLRDDQRDPGEDTWNQLHWDQENSDLSDIWPLRDVLREMRRNGVPAVVSLDLYCYGDDRVNFGELITNLDLSWDIERGTWVLVDWGLSGAVSEDVVLG